MSTILARRTMLCGVFWARTQASRIRCWSGGNAMGSAFFHMQTCLNQTPIIVKLLAIHWTSEWRNRLIWGDKKYVLPSLFEEFAGKVNLIYIDPPFDTGQDFSFNAKVDGEPFLKEPNIIEQKAYRDTWGVSGEERAAGKTHIDKYSQWFYETALILRDLLADTGSIYVHLDWDIVNYVKIIMDEVFGAENFKNEIVWRRTGAHSSQRTFGPIHETLLFYTKTSNYYFKIVNRPYMTVNRGFS